MQLKSLKVFCDVVARHSFSRAASDNGMTQSGASQIVHHLEQYLGVKLIDRSTRPLSLTPEGRTYYEGSRDLVRKLYALEDRVRTLRNQFEGRVHVASIYSVGLSHLNQCVREFLGRYPKARIQIEYQHSHRVRKLVESGRVDLGLISYPKPSRTVKSYTWRCEPMVVCCAPEHPLAAFHEVRAGQLDSLEMVSFDRDLQIRREIDRAFAGKGIRVPIAMEFDNIETLKRAVEINIGFSLLPEPTIRREVQLGSLVARRLIDLEMVRPLGIIYRPGSDLGDTVHGFIQFLLTLAGSNHPDDSLAG